MNQNNGEVPPGDYNSNRLMSSPAPTNNHQAPGTIGRKFYKFFKFFYNNYFFQQTKRYRQCAIKTSLCFRRRIKSKYISF